VPAEWQIAPCSANSVPHWAARGFREYRLRQQVQLLSGSHGSSCPPRVPCVSAIVGRLSDLFVIKRSGQLSSASRRRPQQHTYLSRGRGGTNKGITHCFGFPVLICNDCRLLFSPLTGFATHWIQCKSTSARRSNCSQGTVNFKQLLSKPETLHVHSLNPKSDRCSLSFSQFSC